MDLQKLNQMFHREFFLILFAIAINKFVVNLYLPFLKKLDLAWIPRQPEIEKNGLDLSGDLLRPIYCV